MLLAALSFYCALSAAQTMRDPTRPPPGLGGMQASAVQAPASGPVLQSVILSPSRHAAIISGRLVERGAYYGDALLVEVAQDRVVLRTGAGKPADEFAGQMANAIPAGRFGTPAEFGALCAYVCSAHAAYITGQNLLIDGGNYPGTF